MAFTIPTVWSRKDAVHQVYPGTPIRSGNDDDEHAESLVLNDRYIRAVDNPVILSRVPYDAIGTLYHWQTTSTSLVEIIGDMPFRSGIAQRGLIWTVWLANSGGTATARLSLIGGTTSYHDLTMSGSGVETLTSGVLNASGWDSGTSPWANDTTLRIKVELQAVTAGTAVLRGIFVRHADLSTAEL